ncbi:hypothetical protein ACU4GD_04360 [Cupriavidus basilensis]
MARACGSPSSGIEAGLLVSRVVDRWRNGQDASRLTTCRARRFLALSAEGVQLGPAGPRWADSRRSASSARWRHAMDHLGQGGQAGGERILG